MTRKCAGLGPRGGVGSEGRLVLGRMDGGREVGGGGVGGRRRGGRGAVGGGGVESLRGGAQVMCWGMVGRGNTTAGERAKRGRRT